MLRFKCLDSFYDLSEDAAQHVIHQAKDCPFCCTAENKRELIKLIVEHATEVHGLEDRRLAPAEIFTRVEAHIDNVEG